MEHGVKRWIVDISNWDPSPQDFSFALSLLPQQEHSSITRFLRTEDRKRAVVSRLLQYALVHDALRIQRQEILISRTPEGKPYLEGKCRGSIFPNFNFSVSHHGDYVAIASEPLCIVGLDIVSPSAPLAENVWSFVEHFSSYFSSLEWSNIIHAGAEDEILVELHRYWCLKEAYVKAGGSGMSSELSKVEFHHKNWTDISVKVNGVTQKEWRFWLLPLAKGHWVSVARGHPHHASEGFKNTFSRTEFKEAFDEAFSLSNPTFISQTVHDLIAMLQKAN